MHECTPRSGFRSGGTSAKTTLNMETTLFVIVPECYPWVGVKADSDPDAVFPAYKVGSSLITVELCEPPGKCYRTVSQA